MVKLINSVIKLLVSVIKLVNRVVKLINWVVVKIVEKLLMSYYCTAPIYEFIMHRYNAVKRYWFPGTVHKLDYKRLLEPNIQWCGGSYLGHWLLEPNIQWCGGSYLGHWFLKQQSKWLWPSLPNWWYSQHRKPSPLWWQLENLYQGWRWQR